MFFLFFFNHLALNQTPFFVTLCGFFFFFPPKGPFPAAGLGINAFSSIRIVNTTPGALSQTVPSLMSAAEAQLLLHPSQVLSLSLYRHKAPL